MIYLLKNQKLDLKVKYDLYRNYLKKKKIIFSWYAPIKYHKLDLLIKNDLCRNDFYKKKII